jgi:CheY-like chemotaxis protein
VADDDTGILNLVSQLLQLNDFFAVTAPDGLSALERVRQLNPALVLLDVQMPGMDGAPPRAALPHR